MSDSRSWFSILMACTCCQCTHLLWAWWGRCMLLMLSRDLSSNIVRNGWWSTNHSLRYLNSAKHFVLECKNLTITCDSQILHSRTKCLALSRASSAEEVIGGMGAVLLEQPVTNALLWPVHGQARGLGFVKDFDSINDQYNWVNNIRIITSKRDWIDDVNAIE